MTKSKGDMTYDNCKTWRPSPRRSAAMCRLKNATTVRANRAVSNAIPEFDENGFKQGFRVKLPDNVCDRNE